MGAARLTLRALQLLEDAVRQVMEEERSVAVASGRVAQERAAQDAAR